MHANRVSTYKSDKQKAKPNPRADFFTRVPITGFLNLYEARNKHISRFWISIIGLASILVIYYIGVTIYKGVTCGKVIDVRMFFDEDKLSFPNVSVCAPVIINRTYVGEAISIPIDILNWLKKKNRSVETFLDDFSNYMAFSVRVKALNVSDLKYFDKVYAANFDWSDVSKFYRESQPVCRKMVKDCFFDDVPFDCCENAEFRLLEDGVCYTLSRPLADDSLMTDRAQRRTGPAAGLTFQASIERRDTAFVEADHAEGFRIQIDHVASLLNSPVAVPLGASATIRLKGRNVIRDRSCLHEITDQQVKSLRASRYYDPGGIRCKEEKFMDLLVYMMGCQFPLRRHLSNHSGVCSPRTFYFVETLVNTAFDPEILRKIDMNRVRSAIRGAFYNDQCLPLCSDWEYDIFASYLTMTSHLSQNFNTSTDASFSRVSIFYGELSHFEYVHRQAISAYTTVSDIGGIACLYLGLSMTAVMQLVVYGFNWTCKKKKKKSHKKKAQFFSMRKSRRIHPS